MYTVNVRWSDDIHERAGYTGVKEYEIKDNVLTLAFDENHDLVVPLYQVTTVDIVREAREGQ